MNTLLETSLFIGSLKKLHPNSEFLCQSNGVNVEFGTLVNEDEIQKVLNQSPIENDLNVEGTYKNGYLNVKEGFFNEDYTFKMFSIALKVKDNLQIYKLDKDNNIILGIHYKDGRIETILNNSVVNVIEHDLTKETSIVWTFGGKSTGMQSKLHVDRVKFDYLTVDSKIENILTESQFKFTDTNFITCILYAYHLVKTEVDQIFNMI